MISVNEPLINLKAKKYIIECLDTGWVSSQGKYIDLFEKKFAKFIGTKYALTTTSGTTALHLVLVSLGISKNDEVIMPTLTMGACLMAVLYTGASPVLVDSEEVTGNIDVSQIENKITTKTKAIMVVHLYGHPVDIDPVLTLARKYKLFVIEDAAEAHGATYKGRNVGGFGNIGCFSFYANKIITTGEGGMIVTNNKKIFEKARRLKDLAHTENKRFLHDMVGFNYRMTNLQAALGLAQLEKVASYIDKKRQMAKLYRQNLCNIPGLTLPSEKDYGKNVYWMYAILVNKKKFGLTRDQLMVELQKEGIETRSYFIPIHKQPVCKKLNLKFLDKYPIAEDLSKRGLYLPSGLAITDNQIKTVCKTIRNL